MFKKVKVKSIMKDKEEDMLNEGSDCEKTDVVTVF